MKDWSRPSATALATALIFGADLIIHARRPAPPVMGVLDEAAHAATVYVLLGPLARRASRAWCLGATAGAVLLDVDHLPGVFGQRWHAAPDERPYSHSLIVALALTGVGRGSGGARRHAAYGAAVGVVAHLVRDMATGGCHFYWPFLARRIPIPYWGYAAVLVLFPWAARRAQGAWPEGEVGETHQRSRDFPPVVATLRRYPERGEEPRRDLHAPTRGPPFAGWRVARALLPGREPAARATRSWSLVS